MEPQPQGPEAIPDFQIEGKGETRKEKAREARKRKSRTESRLARSPPVDLVRFSLFAYIHVIRAYQHDPVLFSRPAHRSFCISLI